MRHLPEGMLLSVCWTEIERFQRPISHRNPAHRAKSQQPATRELQSPQIDIRITRLGLSLPASPHV